MLLLSVASGPFVALYASYTGNLVDTAIVQIPTGDLRPVYHLLLLILTLTAMDAFATFLSGLFTNRANEKIDTYVIEETLRIAGNVDYLRFISPEHRDAQSMYAKEFSNALTMGMSILSHGLKSVVSFISYSVLLFSIAGIPVVLLGIASTILVGYVDAKAENEHRKIIEKSRRSRREMEYIDGLYMNAASFSESTLFGSFARLASLFSEAFAAFSDIRTAGEDRIAKTKIRLALLQTVIMIAAILSFFLFGNINSAGTMTVAFTSFSALLALGSSLGFIFAMVSSMCVFIRAFNDYRAEYEHPAPEGDPPERISGAPAVKLEHAYFAYDQDHPVLSDISLTIEPGQTAALVGENGAGKTTLANVILGLFPCEGKAETFGRNAYDARIRGATDSVAVLQNFGRYSAMTLHENIGFDEAVDVSRLSQLDDFFSEKDYSVIVGDKFGGKGFSGGEWQKIALARCTMSAADIMILDEPTAALDPMAEVDVFRSFMEANKHKTCILITHRLGAVRNADVIFVLKDKRIIEHGNHSELMRCAGYYADMFRAQAQWYVQETGI